MNGKYVWDVAKEVCDFINTHEVLINISSFGENRRVMKNVMKVIKEAHNVERKRRQSTRKKKRDVVTVRIQRTKPLILPVLSLQECSEIDL